jgi:hypothetical protein
MDLSSCSRSRFSSATVRRLSCAASSHTDNSSRAATLDYSSRFVVAAEARAAQSSWFKAALDSWAARSSWSVACPAFFKRLISGLQAGSQACIQLHKEMISNSKTTSEPESVVVLIVLFINRSFNLVKELEHPMRRWPDLSALTGSHSQRHFIGGSRCWRS